MVDLYEAMGIDQHISSQLMDVAAWRLHAATASKQFQMGPHGSWAEDVPRAPSFHSVRLVEHTLVVDQ